MRTLKVNRVLCAVLGATLAAGIVPATAVPRANADGWTIVQYTSYDGNAVLQTDTVNGYAYALSEVRGGLVYPLVERDAYFTPSGGSKAAATPDAALGDGAQWYKPGAGTLVFQDLVPGKTYRLSGISAAALPAGAGPAAVAAAYTDTTMKAAKDSAPTNLTLAPDGQAASVVLGASDSRAEYALLTKDNAGHWVPLDADGTMLTPASQTASWQAGTGAALSFDGLSLGRGYRLIARSAGYSELSWSVIAANEASGVVEIEIPQAISDVTVAMVSRSSSAEADLVSLTGVDPVATYHILNAHTGEQLWQGSGADHYTASLGARQSSTLQVVAEAGGAFTRGVRVYPYPVYVDAEGSLHTLTVDYVAETVTSADAQQGLPADIQFRIDYSGQNLITTPTTADGFLDAPGGWIYLGAATPYTAAPILDSIESGAATLTYRLRPSDGYDGAYLAPASTLSIPARPEFTTDLEYQPADSSGTAPAVDWSRFRWGEETIFGIPFSEYGYTGMEDQTLVVREPAVAGEKFASKPVDFLVLKRPAAPTLIFEHNDSRQEWWISSATSGSYQFYCPDNPDPGPGDVDWGSVWGHCHFPDITYIRSKADPATHTPNSWIQRLNDHPIDIADMDFGTADYGYPAPEMQKVVIRDNNYYAQQNQLTDWHTSIELADVTKDGKAFAGEAFYLGATTAAELPALTTGQTTDAQYEVGVKAGLTPGIYQANLVLHFDDGFDTTSPGTDDTALGSLTFVVTGKTEWSFGNLSDAVSLTHDGAGLSIKATSGLPADGVAEYSRDLVTWHDPQAELGSDSWDEELGWAQAYTFYVRVAGDDLHNTSAPQLLEEKVYTAFQAPTWAETLRVNYAAETIEFVRGVRAADYAVTAAGEDIAANGSLSAFADAGGGDIVVRRAGAADIHDGPATSAPSTLAVAGRPAPPGPGDVDTANSESNLKATGRITEVSGKAFEYRAKGSDDLWKYVGDGEATDVANGEYEVRYPATETSFGSAALDVQVGADQMIQGKLLKLFGADVTPSEGDGAQGTEYVVSAYVETSTLAVTNADLLVTEGATADSLNASLAPGAETAVDVTVRAGVVLTYYKLKIWRHAQTAELQTLLANIRALETHDIFKGYTADSVHALGLVMDACDTVVADQYATQDAVDAKLVALTTAVADLEPLTPVVSPAEDELAAVRDLVDFATGLNSASYTNESFIALLEKVAAAEALLAEGSPGSDELAQAKDELLNALVHLRYHYTEQVATQVTSVVVKRKKTFQIGGLAYLTSGKTEDLDYESSDPAVATVNASGKVTGKATGTATITASSKTPGVDGNPVTATVAVQVVSKPPSVKKVSADAPKELAPAQQVWLHASWSKASAAPGKVTFATSNKKIVTVDKTGKVTAVGSGTVKIKVKAGSKSKTYSIRVAKLNSVRPTITGQKSVGSLLTAVPGVWGPGAVTLSYQWLRSGKAIAGATQDTYLLQPEDVGKKIQVKVTGSKDGYPSLSATSKQYVKATRG